MSSDIGKTVGNLVEADGFVKAGKFVGEGWLAAEGELNLSIKTVGSLAKGRDVFKELYKFIDSNYEAISSIKGTWVAGNMGDNLKTFNELVAKYGPEKAAQMTFTGKMASELGFKNVKVHLGEKDKNGLYTSIEAIFTR